MNIQEFICKYQEAFGKNTPLPIAFGYHHKAAEEVKKIPRCMIGAIRKVCDGKPLTLSADNVLCGGGSLYTAFAPMPDRVPVFVSEVEHYKQNQEQVKAYINQKHTSTGWIFGLRKSLTSTLYALTSWKAWKK